MQRRINPDEIKNYDRLKAVAGFLKQLTYSEMKHLASLLQQKEYSSEVSEGDYPTLLLLVADEILNEKSE